jgi:hypothetical protein
MNKKMMDKNLVLEAGYYGSSGTHLIGFRDLNQSQVGGFPPYPQFALVLSVRVL